MTLQKDIHTNMEHLNDSSSALYVDGLLQDDLSMLPEDVLDHVEDCAECKDKILDLFLFQKRTAHLALEETGQTASAPYEEPAVPLYAREDSPPEFSQNRSGQRSQLRKGAAPPPSEGPGDPLIVQEEEFSYYRSSRRSQLRKAAAIFIVFSFVLIFYFLGIKNELIKPGQAPAVEDTNVQEQVQTGTQESAKETPAKVEEPGTAEAKKTPPRPSVPPAYRVNPNLENMIGSPSRSGVVQILSPANNIYLEGEILFSWEETKQEPLHLKILSNKNEVLYRYQVEDSRYLFKEELPPGLYYWKLESLSDLLYVGKFFIK